MPASVPSRRLPEHPNIEQLRNQAKDLLRSYRNGDAAALAEVQHFEQNPAKELALNDAQRILAHSYGFASWPKLKAYVDGVTIARFMQAVQDGDMPQVRSMLASRPELIGMDRAQNNEHRGIHYAVLERNAAMVRLLMEAGADAHKGIWPHRDATTALTLAQDRGYDDIVVIIEEEEKHRREEMSCLNATVSPAQDEISRAIARGDSIAAKQLLEADLSLLHACDRDGRTPLHLAAPNNDIELVQWLLSRRASVRKKDPHGHTPLDLAALAADPRNNCAQRFPEIAKLLLAHGAELTIRAAIALGDEDAVRQAILADSSWLNSRNGLLTLAVNHAQRDMVRLLLDLGADVDERHFLESVEEPTQSWGGPLWYSALANNLVISQLLLDRGADPNANVYASGWPLGTAWNHPGGAVKNLLLERGAKPQPYMVSAHHDIEEAQKLLANHPDEHTVQELAWSAADHGCPEIVEMALPHLNWPLDDQRWYWILIQPMRDVEPEPSANEGLFASLAVILRHGVSPNIRRMGQTPLHFAAASRGLPDRYCARFAAMLLDHGADVGLRDDILRSTPLGWACRWGRQEMAATLLERGAPVHEPDAEPWATPMAWAEKMNHKAILAMLRAEDFSD